MNEKNWCIQQFGKADNAVLIRSLAGPDTGYVMLGDLTVASASTIGGRDVP